jgi:hypothetical protein
MSRKPRPEGPEGMLWCSRGRHFAPVSEFSIKKRYRHHKRTYYHGWCKACASEYARENKQ